MIAPSLLVVVVACALAIVALVFNQVQARLGLVELTLNDGWPPGHAPTDTSRVDVATIDPQQALAPGLHLFLSRGCHACQRLIDELADGHPPAHPTTFHYVDRPRPTSRALADAWAAQLLESERELAQSLGADPLPYAIAVGPHGLVARSVAPTRSTLVEVAGNAGLNNQRPTPRTTA
jgi:hypothetical protein